jgi:hypothetical protein
MIVDMKAYRKAKSIREIAHEETDLSEDETRGDALIERYSCYP